MKHIKLIPWTNQLSKFMSMTDFSIMVLVATVHASATATVMEHALLYCNWSVSHAGGAGTGMATGAVAAGTAVPDPGLGTGTGEDASICCKRRLGCSAFRGLNLRDEKRDEREEDTTAKDRALCRYSPGTITAAWLHY